MLGNGWARTTSATWTRHLFPVWLNNTSLVQSITWSDTAICLCCHLNCLGSVHSNCRVLPFCHRHLKWPRGSRLQLPEMTARNLHDGFTCVYGRYHHNNRQQHIISHITLPTTTAPTEPGGGCRRSPGSVKITRIHLVGSCGDGLPHTATFRATAQSNMTSSSFSLHRSDELAVMDGRESVRMQKFLVRRAVLCHLMSSALWRPTRPIRTVLSGCGRFMTLPSWGHTTSTSSYFTHWCMDPASLHATKTNITMNLAPGGFTIQFVLLLQEIGCSIINAGLWSDTTGTFCRCPATFLLCCSPLRSGHCSLWLSASSLTRPSISTASEEPAEEPIMTSKNGTTADSL